VNAIRFYRAIGAAPQEDWLRYSLSEAAMRELASIPERKPVPETPRPVRRS
jgi:hypothetical protein